MPESSSVSYCKPNSLNNIPQCEPEVQEPVTVSPDSQRSLNPPKILLPSESQPNAARFASHSKMRTPPKMDLDSGSEIPLAIKITGGAMIVGGALLCKTILGCPAGGLFVAAGLGLLSTNCGGKKPGTPPDGGPDSMTQDQGVVRDVPRADAVGMDVESGVDQVVPNDSQPDSRTNDPQMDMPADLPNDMVCSSTSFVLEKISDPSVKGPGVGIGCANINGPGDYVAWNPILDASSRMSLGIYLYSRGAHQSKKISLDEATGNCSIDDSGSKVAFAVRTGNSPLSGVDQVIKLYDGRFQSTQTYFYNGSGNENDAPQLTSDGNTLAYYNFNYDSTSPGDAITMENVVVQSLLSGGPKVVSIDNFNQTFLNINGNFVIYQDPGSGNLLQYDLIEDTARSLEIMPTWPVISANDAGNLITFSNGNNQPAGQPAQIFLLDASTNQVQTLEDVDGYLSAGPFISRNGQCVAWNSGDASDPDANSKILVRDLSRGQTQIVNVSSNGELTNKGAELRDIDANCENLLYSTAATNLTNGCGNFLNDQERAANLYVVGLNSFFSQP